MERCPRCGQPVARRSPRAGFLEHLASVVFLYPFRCQLCDKRFHAFHFRRYERHAPDRRDYERLTIRVPVTVTSAAGEAEGMTADLSLNGCSVKTAAALPVGGSVRVRLRIGQSGTVDVEAAAVRSQREDVFGLRFDRVAGAERERLSQYIARFLRPTATGTRRRGPRRELLLVALIGLGVIVLVFVLMGKTPTLRR